MSSFPDAICALAVIACFTEGTVVLEDAEVCRRKETDRLTVLNAELTKLGAVIEEKQDVPFLIKRAYWIYDVPGGEDRGGHAYLNNIEFIVAISGSFDIYLDNGKEKEVFHLNRSYYGLLVDKCIWRQMKNFSTNSLAFIVSSENYDE